MFRLNVSVTGFIFHFSFYLMACKNSFDVMKFQLLINLAKMQFGDVIIRLLRYLSESAIRTGRSTPVLRMY